MKVEAEQTAAITSRSEPRFRNRRCRSRRRTRRHIAQEQLESVWPVHGSVLVEDGIITSAGVASGIDMAFGVVERLFGRAVADETAHYIEYRRVEATA